VPKKKEGFSVKADKPESKLQGKSQSKAGKRGLEGARRSTLLDEIEELLHPGKKKTGSQILTYRKFRGTKPFYHSPEGRDLRPKGRKERENALKESVEAATRGKRKKKRKRQRPLLHGKGTRTYLRPSENTGGKDTT